MKVRLAKDLANRHQIIDLDGWTDIIEYTCVEVLKYHRQGAPVIRLLDYGGPSEGLKFRVAPFLQERQTTVLFGDGETGKSWLAMFMGYQVAFGRSLLDMDAEPGKVLYLDYETDEDTVWERLNMISAGDKEAIPDNFFYRRMFQPLADDIQAVSEAVINDSIDMVVVDSAAPACQAPGPTNDGAANNFLNALRGLNCTGLVIAHVAKETETKWPFGSVFWRNTPRSNFRTFAEIDHDVASFVVALKNTKANNAKRVKDHAYEVVFNHDANTVTFNLARPDDVQDYSSQLPISTQVADALSGGAMRPTEIAEAIGKTERQVRNALGNQNNRKRFIRLEKGLWGLRQLT